MAGIKNNPITSPFVAYETLDNQVPPRSIRLTVTFDTSQNLTGATVFRDSDCQWTKVLIDLGTDGTPDTSLKSIRVPSGTTNFNKQQINSQGFTTLNDIMGFQTTASR